MQTIIKSPLVATLHAIGVMVVCTPVVTQVDKIHCRWVATIKVKESCNHGYSSESVHTGIWWGKTVRVKYVLWVSWCQVVVYLNASPNRRGDKRCGCAAYVMACPKAAVVVWTLTKVIRLEWTVLAWDEFQRSSYCFTQNRGVPVESADVISDERMCCADGYESILGFSFPWCHKTLLHRTKIRQFQMRGCVVLMDMNQYWDFPFHGAIKHYYIVQKLGNFRWEDVLCWWIWINIGIFLSMVPSNTITSYTN